MNDDYFLENCFYKNNKSFCTLPKEYYKCELGALNFGEIPKNCLTQLPSKSTITKIGNDLYINPFEPIIFTVNCGYGEHMIRIDKPSKITNDMECLINSTDFLFNPGNNSNNKYELYILDPSNSYKQFFNPKEVDLWEFYLTISYIILITITYTITLCITICKIKKKILIANRNLGSTNSESANSIHFYESVY